MRNTLLGGIGRPRLTQTQGNDLGAEFLQHRHQRGDARRLIGDGIDHGALLAERQGAAQGFRVRAIETERHGNGFLHDVHQPRQDFQFLAGQPAIHVEHVGAGVHLSAGDFLEELHIASRRGSTDFLASAIDQFTDN